MQTHNLVSVKQGNTYPGAKFTLQTTDLAFNLLGATIVMKLKLAPGQTVKAILSSEEDNGKILITGDYTFEIAAHVVEVPANTYEYDIKILFATGLTKTWIGGTWQILTVITD